MSLAKEAAKFIKFGEFIKSVALTVNGKKDHMVWVALWGIFLTACGNILQGQDPSMSQFYANYLYMNPAMAGTEGAGKVYIGYRNQWPGSGSNYAVYHASYEQYIEKVQGGVAFHVMNDVQGGGTVNTMSMNAMYAYHLKVSSQLLVTGGMQASLGHRNLSGDGLVLPGDLQAGTEGQVSGSSVFYPDFSVGFSAFYKGSYGGIAVHHLHQPYMSTTQDPNTRLSRRYTMHFGILIPIFERRFGREIMQLSPNLVFVQQNIYQQLNYGLEIHFRDLLFGLWGRQDLKFSYGSVIFSVGYAREQFRFRYSYDARLSSPELQMPAMGAHEIGLAYVINKLDKSPRRRAIKSPKI